MLKTRDMHQRLTQSGFSDGQADGLIAVIEELSEVFVTKGFLRAELAEMEQRQERRMRNWGVGLAGLLVAIIGLLLAGF